MIISSDWHLRSDIPKCRTEKSVQDWLETQCRAIRFVVDTANQYDTDIFHCGDVFDRYKVDPVVTNMLRDELSRLQHSFYCIAGNHDLNFHEIENLSITSIYEWVQARGIPEQLGPDCGAHFRTEPRQPVDDLLVLHTLTFRTKSDLPPNVKALTAGDLLDRYPEAEMLLVGDNHQPWEFEEGNRVVISPGCLVRQSAGEKDIRPRIILVDKDYVWESIPLPPESEDVIDIGYLSTEQARDERITAFVEKLESKAGLSLSFRDNLIARLREKDITPEIEKVVYEIIGR